MLQATLLLRDTCLAVMAVVVAVVVIVLLRVEEDVVDSRGVNDTSMSPT